MKNSSPADVEDSRTYQIIDANLDRAREGLRVLEDWARFGLGKSDYVASIKNFRQMGAPTAGHPEYHEVDGVETTTGPLGQGFATAVGMALGAKMLASRFNSADDLFSSKPPLSSNSNIGKILSWRPGTGLGSLR